MAASNTVWQIYPFFHAGKTFFEKEKISSATGPATLCFFPFHLNI
jgi:hypothetical protein